MIVQMRDDNRINKLLSLFNVSLSELYNVKMEDENSISGFLSNGNYYDIALGNRSIVMHLVYENIGMLFNGEFQISKYPFKYNAESAVYDKNDKLMYYKNKCISAEVADDKLERNIGDFASFYNQFVSGLDNVCLVNAPVIDDLLRNFCDLNNVKYKFAINMIYENVSMLCYWIIDNDGKVYVLWRNNDICAFMNIDRNINQNNEDQYLSYNISIKFCSIQGNKTVELMRGNYNSYYSKDFADGALSDNQTNFHNFVSDLFSDNKSKSFNFHNFVSDLFGDNKSKSFT
jgi:hypothetical protein